MHISWIRTSQTNVLQASKLVYKRHLETTLLCTLDIANFDHMEYRCEQCLDDVEVQRSQIGREGKAQRRQRKEWQRSKEREVAIKERTARTAVATELPCEGMFGGTR